MPRAAASPRSRSRADEARERMYRELVLECAERVFARRGYHASRMQDVAAEAGVSLSTLYGAFPGKREVFDAIHAWRGEAFLARCSAALDAQAPAREALWQAVRAFVEYLLEHPDYFRVDLREGRSWAVGEVEANLHYQKGIRKWKALMARGIAEGVFRDEPPDRMATTVFGLLQVRLATELLHERSARRDTANVAQAVAESVERQVCRLEVLAEPAPWESDS